MSAELRTQWVCTNCSVRLYNACGDAIPRPEGWTDGRCLTCAREEEKRAARQAADDATEKALVDMNNALTELLTSDPGLTNKELGERILEITSKQISEKRAALGLPTSAAYLRKKNGAASVERAAVRKRLEDGPLAMPGDVAEEVGVSIQLVRKVMRELSLVPPMLRCDECGKVVKRPGALAKHQECFGHRGATVVPAIVGSN